jgi:hypothetical protein
LTGEQDLNNKRFAVPCKSRGNEYAFDSRFSRSVSLTENFGWIADCLQEHFVKYLENLVGSMKNLMRPLCLVEAPLTVSWYATPSVTQAGSQPLRRPRPRTTVSTLSGIASCPNGEWRVRDIIFEALRFDKEKLRKAAYITVVHNGILAHNHDSALTTGLSEHRSLSNNYFDEGEQDEHWNASTSDAEW